MLYKRVLMILVFVFVTLCYLVFLRARPHTNQADEEIIDLIAMGMRNNFSKIVDIKGKIHFDTVFYPAADRSIEWVKKQGIITFYQRGWEPKNNLRLVCEYEFTTKKTTGQTTTHATKEEQLFTESKFIQYFYGTDIKDGKREFIPGKTATILDKKEYEPLINPIDFGCCGSEKLVSFLENRVREENRISILGEDTVDNTRCYILRLVPKYTDRVYRKIWVAPDKGFTIPKWQGIQVWGNEEVVIVERTAQIKQYPGGIWFASSAHTKTVCPDIRNVQSLNWNNKPSFRLQDETNVIFTDLVFNSGLSDQDIQIKFPPRTLIHDRIANTMYYVGDDRYPEK